MASRSMTQRPLWRWYTPNQFNLQRGTIVCVVDGEQRGRTAFEPSELGPHEVATGVESDQLSMVFDAVMREAFGDSNKI